jgi:hypothetical protein
LQDASVRELESLKHSIGKTIQMMKSHSTVYTDNNGQREAHSERNEQVNEDGKLVARVDQRIDVDSKGDKPLAKIQTEVDVPAKGIHKSVVQQVPAEYQTLTENGNRRSSPESLPESGNSVSGAFIIRYHKPEQTKV